MTGDEQKTITRRQIVHTGVATGATVMAPQFVQVASGATQSGEVELTTTSTQPSGTAIEVRIYEDTDGDGTAESQQAETISAGTDVVTEYAALDGVEGQGNVYWMEITLTTSDDTATPELDSATVTLPEEGATPEPTPIPDKEPQGISAIWDNYLFFVTGLITVVAAIGLASGSLAVAAFAGYLTFTYVALETGTPLLENILYVTLVLVFIGFAFKFWRLEGMGDGE